MSNAGVDRRDARWDIRYGPKNYAVLVGAQAASALFSFAAVWIATRSLRPSGYGGVVAIIAISQCVVQLMVNWTTVSLSRYGCEEFVETGRLARAFWARLAILLLNLLVVTATAPLWLPFLSSWLHVPPRAYPLVLGHFLATAFWLHGQQTLLGAKLIRLQAGLLTAERALIFLILAAQALSGKISLVSVTLAYIISPLVACAIGLWHLRSLVYPGISLDRQMLKKMLIFSAPLIPYSFFSYLSTSYLDAFFIARYLSIADLGIYAVVYQLSGMAMQLPFLAGSLVLPLFVTLQVGGQDASAIRFLHQALPLLCLFWSIACVLAAAFGGYLVPLAFGFDFRGAHDLLWPLMAASAVAGPMLMGYVPMSNAKSATYVMAAAATVAAGANVIFNALLIPQFGLKGCAWATAICYTACTVTAISIMRWRVTLTWGWSLQAALPALVGAAFYAWQRNNQGAVIAAFITAGLVALLHRADVVAGLVFIRNRGRFATRHKGTI